MDSEVEAILRSGEGRFLSVEEARRVLAIAKTYEQRLSVCVALEGKEETIARKVTELTMAKFPKFRERHLADEKSIRDISLILRYIAHSILRNDPEFLREKLLFWMQGVFASKGFGQTTRAAYEFLRSVVTEELPPPAAIEVNRFVDICIESCARYQDAVGAS